MSRWLIAALVWGLASAPASTADLSDAAIRAYDEFFAGTPVIRGARRPRPQ